MNGGGGHKITERTTLYSSVISVNLSFYLAHRNTFLKFSFLTKTEEKD